MKLFDKYGILFLSMLSFCMPVVAQEGEQGQNPAEPVDVKVPDTEFSARDWGKRYSMRSAMLFDRNLMGEEPGVYTSFGGFSGNTGVLMLRGLNTVNLSASPYVVMDGLIVRHTRNISPFASGVFQNNVGFINPLDVAGIKVLKGGFDNVFYGGRAGNGIVEVEADKGTLGSSAIDASLRVGFSEAQFRPDLMNAAEYRAFLYDMMASRGMTNTELQSNPLFDPAHPEYSHDTYWPGLLDRKGMFSDFHLKMKGGDGETFYLFSIGYTNEQGVLKAVEDQRFNMRFNLDFKVSPKVEMSSFFSYNYGTNRFFSEGADWKTNPLYLTMAKAPFMSPDFYTQGGDRLDRPADTDVLGMTNPAVLEDNMKNTGKSNRIDALVQGRWQVLPKLKLNTELVVSYNTLAEKLHQQAYGIAMERYIERQNAKRSYSEYLMRWRLWLEKFGRISEDLAYDAGAGFSMDLYKEKMIYGRQVNAANDQVESVTGGLADSIGNIRFDHNMMNIYLNGGLTFRNSLRLAVAANLERSSNFGPEGRWNLYAGAQLRWTALKNSRERIEFYGEYGRSGNNDVRGGLYARYYRPVQYYQFGGVYIGNLRNDDLKPEVTDDYEGGVHAAFFGNLVEAGVSYYYKRTSRLLTLKALPVEIGVDPQYENNGVVTNQGVELSLAINPVQKENLKVSLFGTLSTLKNRVEKLNNGEIVRKMDGFTGVAREGEELGAFYGYRVKGIFKTQNDLNLLKSDGTPYQAGDFIMEDIDGNDKINDLDRQIIGSPLPEFYGGFGTDIRWKALSFSALFTYSYGNDVYNLFAMQSSRMGDYSNQSREVLDRWVNPEHPGKGSLPRAAYGDPSGNFVTSDRWVEDGSYLKLKNVAVQYEIPLKKRSGFVKGMTVSVNCNNLFTVSGYSGFDPEVFSETDPLLRGVDCGAVPNPRSYIFGLNVAF